MKNVEKVKKVKKYFTENKEKEILENLLSIKLNLSPSEVRYAIAKVRYEIPIVKTQDGYIYTTRQKELLKKYLKKLEAQIKQKSIKKNIVKRYL